MHFFLFYLFIYLLMLYTAQVLKVCRTPGPTACLKMLSKVCLKSWRRMLVVHPSMCML